jgi:HlyD family secretion protein
VRIAEVTRGTLVRDATVTGRVIAAVSPTLYAPVAGTVTLSIRAGDTVTEGQVIATIASPELESQLRAERSTLEQLDSQTGAARIGGNRQRLAARREADEAEIALTAANRELQSAQRAFDLGAIPELELLRAQDAVRNAKVRSANAKRAIELAGESTSFDLKTAQKQRERQRVTVTELERRIAELEVRAPVSGVVGTLSVVDRAVIPANAPLMTIVDLGKLEVELKVPETYADDLGLGMAVELSIGTTKATGTLSVLSPEVVEHHVLARVRFDGEQPAGLRQSQRVTARILIDEHPDVVMVPRGPFMETHGGAHVYVVEDGVAVRRPIRIGATSVSGVEILEGLSPGERVVIAGSESFEDATTVRMLE